MEELNTSLSLLSATTETKRVVRVDVHNGPMGQIRYLPSRHARIIRVVAVSVNDEPWEITVYGRRVRKDGEFVKNSTSQPISTTAGSREEVEAVHKIIKNFREGFLPAGEEFKLSRY